MHPLTIKIVALQRRMNLRRRMVAACRVGGAIIATMIALGALDYSFRYTDRGLRLMATSVLVGTSAWAFYRWWIVHGRRRLGTLTVARRIESHFPQLRDSLTSAIEFLDQSEADATAGSALLRRVVVNETHANVTNLPLDEVVDRRPLRRAAGWLTLALAVALLGAAWDPSALGTAVSRLIVPLGSTEWPRENHLVLRDPPARIAAGQPFEVELFDSNGNLPDQVHIEYRLMKDGRRQTITEPMTRAADSMIARRDDIHESFSFRATGGDDDTMRWHSVEVVEPPHLESLKIRVHPPKYSGMPPYIAERHFNALAGSGIEVTSSANKPLGAARVLLRDKRAIEAEIESDSHGHGGGHFSIAPNQWIVDKGGPYQLELADKAGAAVAVADGNIRVEPDPPPTIAWQRPTDDLYVTTMAIVPIGIIAKDNLAIERVDLIYQRDDHASPRNRTNAENTVAAASVAPAEGQRLELYRGPVIPAPPLRETADRASGEIRVVEYGWDLDPLRLPTGTQLTLQAEAFDYRPGVGRTVGPRRITIISPTELEARIADRQEQIVRQLEHVFQIQQAAREDVRRLEIQQRDTGALTESDRNMLHATELTQRRAGQKINDAQDGILALVVAMQGELDMNRVSRADTRGMLSELSSSLERLAGGPLPVAEQQLTAARKAAEIDEESERLASSLASAGQAQDAIGAELERLLEQMSETIDYRRLLREIARLREDQLQHSENARSNIGLDTLPLEPEELSRSQRAELNKAAAGEVAIERRYVKLEQGMAELADELASDGTGAGDLIQDAMTLATQLRIGAKIQNAVNNLRENHVGRALQLEAEIAADLQRVLDILQAQSDHDTEQLVDKLREAEQRIADLRQNAANLHDELQRAHERSATSSERQAARERGNDLRQEIEKLARELARLEAHDASRSAEQAANRLGDRPNQDRQEGNPAQQAPSKQVQQAEQDLANAAEQLAARRQQAEDDLALEFVRRFQDELEQMVERQRSVAAETTVLDGQRHDKEQLTLDQSQHIERLSIEERDLAATAREQGELLFGLGSLRLSLEGAVGQLEDIAELLAKRETGPEVQRHQQAALKRLEGMREAFAQTAADAGQNNESGGGEGGHANGQQRRPTFELLEVKVLRMLQVELNERTLLHEQEMVEHAALPSGDPWHDESIREAKELAAEQDRLAELVETLLSRDNEEE